MTMKAERKATAKTPPAGYYLDGWRPEASLKEGAKAMLKIIFARTSSEMERQMACSTLIEIIKPSPVRRKKR